MTLLGDRMMSLSDVVKLLCEKLTLRERVCVRRYDLMSDKFTQYMTD